MKKFKLIVILAIASGVSIAGCKKEGKKEDIVTTTYTLIVTRTNGTVVKNPDMAAYNSGSTVQLNATPNSGYTFVSWSGDAAGTTNPLTVTMDANKNITANFTALVVNVKTTGATGNGSTDDTKAIQAAVDRVAGTSGTVLVPASTYMIDAITSVKLGSNMTFRLDSGAVLKAFPNDGTHYAIILISGKTNVHVTGGKVQGERHQHLLPGDHARSTPTNQNGEWGMGIWIAGSSHVTIEGVTVTECWGDGIYQAGWGGLSTDINLISVVADDNRRQGCSIENVNGMVIRNCTFSHTEGAWPMAGIDVEPFEASMYVNNLQITNNQFIDNCRSGISFDGVGPTHITNVTVTGNTISGPGWGIAWKTGGTGLSFTSNTISLHEYTFTWPGGQYISWVGVGMELRDTENGTYRYNNISVTPNTENHAVILENTTHNNTVTNNTITGFTLNPVIQDLSTSPLNIITPNTIN